MRLEISFPQRPSRWSCYSYLDAITHATPFGSCFWTSGPGGHSPAIRWRWIPRIRPTPSSSATLRAAGRRP